MTSKYIENFYEKSLKVFAEIEKLTANWDLDDVQDGVAAEYCTMVGRTITQSRLGDLSYSKRRKQLVALREDTYFCKYASYFDIIKSKMQRSHRIMFGLLKYRMYLAIHFMLEGKNLVSNNLFARKFNCEIDNDIISEIVKHNGMNNL